jgi:hypothetical protein
MIITKKAIRRRTILRGLGATLALPLLDGMVPALTALAKTAAKPTNRFGAVYVPNGIMMQNWTPAAEGAAFEFKEILKPLEPFRDRLLVLSGLNSIPPVILGGSNGGGVHARASTRFLTDIPPKVTNGSDLEAGISMDQVLAKELGRQTQLASLELGLESAESAGSCDIGFSCAYTNTISWRSPSTPLPMEYNPRAVFERLFGDGGTTDPLARVARMRQERSILDSVTEEAAGLGRRLSPGDRAKLGEYLEAIRDVERRIQNAEAQSARELPVVENPGGVPATFEQHAKLMYDLQVLAYQCDLTRVITFMVGREFSGRTYPEIGVPDSHHPISHHQGDPEKLAKLVKINTYHATLFAYFLERLRATPDGDGTLLDHMTIIYGGGMSDSNAHDFRNLPILLVGGGAGQLKGGRHIRYPKDTPLANLHLTLMDKFGVRVDSMGDSTGEIEQISDI